MFLSVRDVCLCVCVCVTLTLQLKHAESLHSVDFKLTKAKYALT